MVDLIERVQAIEDVDSELDDDVDNEENVSLENEITGESYELIEGELVPQARTDNEHGAVCARSIGLLRLYSVQTNQRARIVDSSAAFFMRGDRKNARKPDAAFTFHAHLPATVESVEDYMGVPPDLIIEVISPGNMANEMGEKTREWFAFGVRMVWLVYPKFQRVHVYPNADQAFILRAQDKINGGDVLPGFESSISMFFQD